MRVRETHWLVTINIVCEYFFVGKVNDTKICFLREVEIVLCFYNNFFLPGDDLGISLTRNIPDLVEIMKRTERV